VSFEVTLEHQIVGGKTAVESFEGVVDVNSPPMTSTTVLEFAGDRDAKKLNHGDIVKVKDE
jgi:hypothetical protein